MDDNFEKLLEEKLKKKGPFLRIAVERQLAWELYCSLCNQVWIAKEYDEAEFKQWHDEYYAFNSLLELKFPKYLSYSWRGAGALLSRCVEGTNDYMSFYCCRDEGGIAEGKITDRAKQLWESMGYKLFVDFYKD
jgi:hypothetical protein